MTRQVFVISVAGELDESLRAEFETAEITAERSVTRLRVVCADPSVVHGILHRIDLLGLELLDVRRPTTGAD